MWTFFFHYDLWRFQDNIILRNELIYDTICPLSWIIVNNARYLKCRSLLQRIFRVGNFRSVGHFFEVDLSNICKVPNGSQVTGYWKKCNGKICNFMQNMREGSNYFACWNSAVWSRENLNFFCNQQKRSILISKKSIRYSCLSQEKPSLWKFEYNKINNLS